MTQRAEAVCRPARFYLRYKYRDKLVITKYSFHNTLKLIHLISYVERYLHML